jgi:hypothetical protein
MNKNDPKATQLLLDIIQQMTNLLRATAGLTLLVSVAGRVSAQTLEEPVQWRSDMAM